MNDTGLDSKTQRKWKKEWTRFTEELFFSVQRLYTVEYDHSRPQ